MANFDYISSPDFRKSLISDHAEMRKCSETQSWKSAQVLAGSIVECLLIDYLVSTSNPARTQKDPLKMDLAEAITICRSEGVLSDRTADLCSVVRSYRNLIHPGRMVRLNEDPPNNTTCEIATALIDLIVADISKTRRAAVGLTAEQILSKIIRDPSCMTILIHLMSEVNDEQRLRLLLELIPSAYFEYVEDEYGFDDTKDRLSSAYRSIFDFSSDEIKRRLTQKYVRILKEDDGESVSKYRKAFFRAPDLEYIEPQSIAMVKEHLLASAPSIHTTDSLGLIVGIGEFLSDADCTKWFDPFMRTMASTIAKDHVKKRAKEVFIDTIWSTQPTVDLKLRARINDWLVHYKKLESVPNMELAKQLLDEVASISPP